MGRKVYQREIRNKVKFLFKPDEGEMSLEEFFLNEQK